MHDFDTRDLHFAAYLKMSGAEFMSFDAAKKSFWFRSEVTVAEWRIRHINSCCRRADLELLELRKFLRP